MKLLGAILLIVGTCLGAGVLALPVTTSAAGFFPSCAMLLCCWALMTFSAFMIVEVTLWLPPGANLISMAKQTIGPIGTAATWLVFLLLMYALLSAYIAAGVDVLGGLFRQFNVPWQAWHRALIFVLLFGAIVFRGIALVDNANRLLLTIKLSVFVLVAVLLSQHVKLDYLLQGQPRAVILTTTVMVTSYGYAVIIPTICDYLDNDIRKLRVVLLLGSSIPLLLYCLWIFAVLGAMPRAGQHGLDQLLQSAQPTTDLISNIRFDIHRPIITHLASVFSTISVITSFLGVALGLSDFIADGCKLQKTGRQRWVIMLLTFAPPLLIVIIKPSLFITMLSIAGVLCVTQQVILPACMVYRGRYVLKIANGYRVFAGKGTLAIAVLLAFGIIGLDIIYNTPW